MSGAAGEAARLPAARVAALRRRLLAWYDGSRRALPWRPPRGLAHPYRAWLAEVMLQQTRVEAALPYWRRFLERFPSLEALAAAPEEEVLRLWAGLGYYARARNLHRAARLALARHGGLPPSLEALRELPGFGPYTAGAVASIAFGIRAPAVDGNAARVLARLFLVEARPGERPGRNLASLAAALVPPDRPGDWNQALMDLGAGPCGRAPRCGRCPVASLCRARAEGRQKEVPAPRSRPPGRRLLLACGAVLRGGRLLVARRRGDGLLGGLWELPSAEVRVGAAARRALARSLTSRLGPGLRVGTLLGAVDRELTHRRLRLEAYEVAMRRARTPAGMRWVRAGELGAAGLSAAMRRLAEAVLARRGGAA
ncbi:MAG TPA: A/G-specific adenine glycosylase [Anaeromyxobacteraceae bacterium]